MYADDTDAFYSDKCLVLLVNITQEVMNEVVKLLHVSKLSKITKKS